HSHLVRGRASPARIATACEARLPPSCPRPSARQVLTGPSRGNWSASRERRQGPRLPNPSSRKTARSPYTAFEIFRSASPLPWILRFRFAPSLSQLLFYLIHAGLLSGATN